MVPMVFAILELTLREIVAEVPHDLSALVAYLVLALFVAGIWYGSRGGARPPAEPGSTPTGPGTRRR